MHAKPTHIRLEKLLSNLGYCSRTTAKTFVRKNKITLSGQSIYPKLEEKVDPTQIEINGQLLEALPPLTIALHKPPGYICSRKKEAKGDKLVFDLLPPRFFQMTSPILSFAGRLDKEVTGLVILSQNGVLVNSIISPRKVVPKVYHLKAKLQFSGNEPAIFAKGIQLGDPKKGNLESLNPADFEIFETQRNMAKITLKEGKYHQVSRMMAAVGNKIDTLHRVSVGTFTLGDLQEGQWKYISDDELYQFVTTYPAEEEKQQQQQGRTLTAMERAMLKELDPRNDDFFADPENVRDIDRFINTPLVSENGGGSTREDIKELSQMTKISEEEGFEDWKEKHLKKVEKRKLARKKQSQ